MDRLFGTDGIRGTANREPITAETAVKVGRAVASAFGRQKGAPARVVIGKDTRQSGDMLEAGLTSGICSAGGDAVLLGVLPTPGVAHAAAVSRALAGVAISASHNPYEDNGIKVFDAFGDKLSEAAEAELEARITGRNPAVRNDAPGRIGRVLRQSSHKRSYLKFLLKEFSGTAMPLKGLRVILDCANGAAFEVGPRAFEALGAEVSCLGVNPNGRNINAGCGSEHPEALAEAVVAAKADLGCAFDGDADRLVAVDETGVVRRGDTLLAVFAMHLKSRGRLTNDLVVSTVMSNIGLSIALKSLGISHVTSTVGDRNVIEKMRETGAVLGGEDSGHIILLDRHTTGDGLLSALRLCSVMSDQGKPLSELSRIVTLYPQALINVAVRSKPPLASIPEIASVTRAVETELGNRGRVLVRYSGTQPMCRVMVEGPDDAVTRSSCARIADTVKAHLG